MLDYLCGNFSIGGLNYKDLVYRKFAFFSTILKPVRMLVVRDH